VELSNDVHGVTGELQQIVVEMTTKPSHQMTDLTAMSWTWYDQLHWQLVMQQTNSKFTARYDIKCWYRNTGSQLSAAGRLSLSGGNDALVGRRACGY